MKLLDFAKHFDSEEACEKYLKETREKEGIKCSRCGCEKHYWNRCHKRWMCAKCAAPARAQALSAYLGDDAQTPQRYGRARLKVQS